MEWCDLSNSWKGVVIGGVTFLFSLLGMVLYLVLFLGGVVTMAALNSLMVLGSIKLAWGVSSGFIIGSLIKKK